MAEVEALRTLWVQHQAAAAREQELRLASWRSELADELSRQAAGLAEGLLAQQRQSEAELEAKLDALDARVRQSLETARGEAARLQSEATRMHSEVRVQQSAFEAILRSDIEKLSIEVGQLRMAKSGLGEAAARQGALDERIKVLRSEAAQAEKSLEDRVLSQLRALREQARGDVAAARRELESYWKAQAEELRSGLQRLQLAVQQTASEGQRERTLRAHLDAAVAASVEASVGAVGTASEELRGQMGELGSLVTALERRMSELLERRSEELRLCLHEDISSLQQRLHTYVRQAIAAAFRSHAAHTTAQDWHCKKSVLSQQLTSDRSGTM